MFVDVALVVPSTLTVAPGKGSPSSSVTVPVHLVLLC